MRRKKILFVLKSCMSTNLEHVIQSVRIMETIFSQNVTKLVIYSLELQKFPPSIRSN